MKTVLLVGPSIDLPKPRRQAWVGKQIRSRDPIAVIGVDGGIEFLRGLRPQLVIGDWDSGEESLARTLARGGARMVSLPRKKDFSDLHFALEALPEVMGAQRGWAPREPRELVLLGFTGGRPDHLLANLLELGGFVAAPASRMKFEKVAAIGPEAEYHFLTHGQRPLELIRASRPVSVFAWGGPVRGVTMRGFEYEMKNGRLEPSSRGLSNVVRARRGDIRVGKGTLLVVIPHGR